MPRPRAKRGRAITALNGWKNPREKSLVHSDASILVALFPSDTRESLPAEPSRIARVALRISRDATRNSPSFFAPTKSLPIGSH